jgi:hypothetical protein
MDTEKYIFYIYCLITLVYTYHTFNKGVYDFQIIAFLYICLAMLYYNESNKKKKEKEKSIIKRHISLLYTFCFIIYLKHIYMKDDFDYFYLGLITLIISIIKYNILSNNNIYKLNNIQLTNFLSMFSISLIFFKHSALHDDYDYALISGLYALYTYSDYKLIKKY